MLQLLKNKYVFMFSSIVASGVSYLLNVTLIYLLNDKVQYANYLYINSLAIYLSTFVYLSIIELYISPEESEVELSTLLNVALITLFSFSVALFFLYLIVGRNFLSFSVIMAAIFYALIKLMTQYMLFNKKKDAVIVLRYGRSFFIGVAIVLLYVIKEFLGFTINAEGQLYIQGLICLTVAMIVFYTFRIDISYSKNEVTEIYVKFKSRIAKRNLSMIFDMIHMPILYHFISINSNKMSSAFIYAVGLILPMSYVLSVILKEQLLVRLDLKCYKLVEKFAKANLALIAVMTTIMVLTMNYGDTYQIISLCILSLLIIFSGCVGLIIYKKGLEKYDLCTNIFVMILLLITYVIFPNDPKLQVFFAVCVVSLKFTIQNALSAFGKESMRELN